MMGAGSPTCRPGYFFSTWRRFVFKPKFWAICLNIYCFVLSFVYFFIALPWGSVCRFIFLILLIQVYNWEIRHHSLVCCCGFADILNILEKYKTASWSLRQVDEEITNIVFVLFFCLPCHRLAVSFIFFYDNLCLHSVRSRRRKW